MWLILTDAICAAFFQRPFCFFFGEGLMACCFTSIIARMEDGKVCRTSWPFLPARLYHLFHIKASLPFLSWGQGIYYPYLLMSGFAVVAPLWAVSERSLLVDGRCTLQGDNSGPYQFKEVPGPSCSLMTAMPACPHHPSTFQGGGDPHPHFQF